MTLLPKFAHPSVPQKSAQGALPDEAVIFGVTEAMTALRSRLKAIAGSNLPVLIEGESGTGKVLLARLLHEWSQVAAGQFIQVSCPSVAGTPWASSLFGCDGVSDGNAKSPYRELFASQDGTLCLDEIGELDSSLQAKLLQLLQSGKFCPPSQRGDVEVEIRLVCVTNRELEAGVAAGTFRRDLFYRINVVKFELPPLRDRLIDLPVLCSYFLDLYNREFDRNAKPLSAALTHQLQRYQWPGNIRQLENLMKRYVVLGAEDVFRNEVSEKTQATYAVPAIPAAGSLSLPDASREVRRAFERELILKALEANQWNRRRAAVALNISYRALLYKLKESQCEVPVSD